MIDRFSIECVTVLHCKHKNCLYIYKYNIQYQLLNKVILTYNCVLQLFHHMCCTVGNIFQKRDSTWGLQKLQNKYS